MRIIFMGTPHFAVPALQALIDSDHEIEAVYSQPPRPAGRGMKLTPSPVQLLAQVRGLAVFTPTSLKDAQAQAQFKNHKADIAVVAAYGLLLPPAILGALKHGCINIHPSDLPRWRGAAPLQRTIIAGDRATACCIMHMDEGLDTGPVLLRQSFAIPDGMNFGELQEAMAKLGTTLTIEALQQIENGTARSTPQSADGVTYAAKLTREDQKLNFDHSAAQVRQHILGLSPAPGAVTTIHSETVKIFAATIEPGDAAHPPGVTLDDRLLINCAQGTAVRILQLQRAGRAKQDNSAFLQGFPVSTGTRISA